MIGWVAWFLVYLGGGDVLLYSGAGNGAIPSRTAELPRAGHDTWIPTLRTRTSRKCLQMALSGSFWLCATGQTGTYRMKFFYGFGDVSGQFSQLQQILLKLFESARERTPTEIFLLLSTKYHLQMFREIISWTQDPSDEAVQILLALTKFDKKLESLCEISASDVVNQRKLEEQKIRGWPGKRDWISRSGFSDRSTSLSPVWIIDQSGDWHGWDDQRQSSPKEASRLIAFEFTWRYPLEQIFILTYWSPCVEKITEQLRSLFRQDGDKDSCWGRPPTVAFLYETHKWNRTYINGNVKKRVAPQSLLRKLGWFWPANRGFETKEIESQRL